MKGGWDLCNCSQDMWINRDIKGEVKYHSPNFGEGFVSLVSAQKNHVWMI